LLRARVVRVANSSVSASSSLVVGSELLSKSGSELLSKSSSRSDSFSVLSESSDSSSVPLGFC
jgi:hypothetical protein